MARCPFAIWDPVSGGLGPYAGGPFKIVHHTTEGTTYAGARSAYQAHKSDPHFTVAGDTVHQHIDTIETARSLRNADGGVQTNRDSAVQIEVVGFAGQAKDVPTLRSVARLCRWIEEQHGVPQQWPNGRPRSSTNGGDPGGHNRNPEIWDTLGGHYGHSQVPENTHWDPGYTEAELALVTPDAAFDAHAELAAQVPATAFTQSVSPPSLESADVIARRVVEQLRMGDWPPAGGRPSRLTVRVLAAGVEVEVTIEFAGQT